MCAHCSGSTGRCACPRHELSPVYDGAKSFYGKAAVTTCAHTIRLWSFSTNVAVYDTLSKHVRVFCIPSRTTLRHIREFLLQYGFPAKNKREIVKMYM